MRKMKLGKQIFCGVLTSVLALSLAGCGGGSNGSYSKAADKKSGDTEQLTVMVYDRGNTTETYGSATKNYWTHWIQKKFGDPNNIKLKYVAVPRNEETQKINTMMASGSAPDIIYSYDSNLITQYGRDGGLVELSDLIDKYGANLKKNLADALPYGQSEGKQWAIPAKRSLVGWQTTYIRKDWLDQVGYELKTDENGYYHMSIDDFTKLIRQFKDLDPSNQGGEMYPLGMVGAWNATQTRPIIWSFLETSNLTDEMHACYDERFWPGYKEGVKYLNQLYNEDLVDPEFLTDTDTSYTAFNGLLSNGRTLAFAQDANAVLTGVEALYEADPKAEIVPFYLDNVNGEQFNRVYTPNGMYISIPSTCKHPETAVKYLDWLADYDNAKVLSYGFEGVHYKMDGNKVVTIPHTDEEKAASDDDFERLTVGDLGIIYNGAPYGYEDSTEGMDEVKAKSTQLAQESDKVATVGGQTDYYFQGIQTEADKKYSGLVPSIEDELPRLIACDPDKFDSEYDAVLDNYLKHDGQKIIDDKVKLFEKLEAEK
ncbi:extracellular solute-binding protein [Blautia liquoris]|uniref:Extracellular solute-binding protein n=1 Tax=Blautia liquoris TaxID=2779518 RepID=A0A7M2RFL2_9FIRM|nr:extracellular solute-binding protein [Blautia liquoris]QOV19135.1 extracellular solute-binding protein [Blautia liquoris]